MQNRYAEDTIVYTVYGGVVEYVKNIGDDTHELRDTLSGETFNLKTNEFDKSQKIAWGRKRAI